MPTLHNLNPKKHGKPPRSNVRWQRNYDPIKKIVSIVLSCVGLFSVAVYTNKKPVDNFTQVEIIEPRDPRLIEQENEIRALEGILEDIQRRNRGEVPVRNSAQDVYVWNENGKIRASNTRYPVNNTSVRVIEGIEGSERVTKYQQRGGAILLPVTIGNRGKSYTVNMMLDTGCTITLLDAEIGNALHFQATGRSISTIADGSKMINSTGKVEYIKVGPFRENNFSVNTGYIKGRRKNHYGLLGMNFLKNHPFTIDHNRKLILWQ